MTVQISLRPFNSLTNRVWVCGQVGLRLLTFNEKIRQFEADQAHFNQGRGSIGQGGTLIRCVNESSNLSVPKFASVAQNW